jgi:hypothetical protein
VVVALMVLVVLLVVVVVVVAVSSDLLMAVVTVDILASVGVEIFVRRNGDALVAQPGHHGHRCHGHGVLRCGFGACCGSGAGDGSRADCGSGACSGASSGCAALLPPHGEPSGRTRRNQGSPQHQDFHVMMNDNLCDNTTFRNSEPSAAVVQRFVASRRRFTKQQFVKETMLHCEYWPRMFLRVKELEYKQSQAAKLKRRLDAQKARRAAAKAKAKAKAKGKAKAKAAAA